MKKKTITPIILATALFLTACGSDTATESTATAEAAPTTAETEAPVETEKVTETEAVTETEVETETEAEEIPFAIEHDWKFYDISDFSLGYFTYVNDGATIATSPDYVEAIQGDADISFTEFSKSKPDADGDVTYTITAKISATPTWKYAEGASFSGNCSLPGFVLCDYYTGIVIPRKASRDNATIEFGAKIEIEGKTCPIRCTFDSTWERSEPTTDFIEDGWYKAYQNVTCINIFKIRAPQDYDGLTLATTYATEEGYKKAIENTDADTIDETLKRFGENDNGTFEDTSDYRFIRISDYATETE